MKCPRCVLSIHRAAASCPHCGFAMWHADELFGTEDVSLEKLTDAAGVLRMKERGPLRRVMESFEAKFPQLFVSIYVGAFEELQSIRQMGFWMLNRAHFSDLEEGRENANGILILVDVNAKVASITYGYALLPYLDEDSTFAALSAGHPSFIQGDFLGALSAVIHKLEGFLIRGWKQVKKDPNMTFAESGQSPKRVAELLKEPHLAEESQLDQGEEEAP